MKITCPCCGKELIDLSPQAAGRSSFWCDVCNLDIDVKAGEGLCGDCCSTEENAVKRVAIIIEGGIVQSVYSTDKYIEVEVIDLDTEDSEELEELDRLVEKVETDKNLVPINF